MSLRPGQRCHRYKLGAAAIDGIANLDIRRVFAIFSRIETSSAAAVRIRRLDGGGEAFDIVVGDGDRLIGLGACGGDTDGQEERKRSRDEAQQAPTRGEESEAHEAKPLRN